MRISLLLLALVLSSTCWAQPLKPRDNTKEAPYFEAFRPKLEQAIAQRDAAFFRDRAKGARVTFGEPTTLDKQYKLSDPKSPFWALADRMVKLGGTWNPQSRMVTYPYVYADFPETADPYTQSAVTAKDVPLRKEAAPTSTEVGRVGYEVVKVLETKGAFSKVKTNKGLTGWIAREHLYSSIDHRMGLTLVEGRWTISFFLAGD